MGVGRLGCNCTLNIPGYSSGKIPLYWPIGRIFYPHLILGAPSMFKVNNDMNNNNLRYTLIYTHITHLNRLTSSLDAGKATYLQPAHTPPLPTGVKPQSLKTYNLHPRWSFAAEQGVPARTEVATRRSTPPSFSPYREGIQT
jgi:hypothetical protein